MGGGVQQPFFWKTVLRHFSAFFGQKNQIQKFQLSFVLPFLLFQRLANLKKDNFQTLNLKHRKLNNPIFAPFFEKGYF